MTSWRRCVPAASPIVHCHLVPGPFYASPPRQGCWSSTRRRALGLMPAPCHLMMPRVTTCAPGWVLAAIFLDETRLAFMAMGFCYPGRLPSGGDAPPQPECASLWYAALLTRMPQIELVLLVGGYVLRRYLGNANMTAAVRVHALAGPSCRFPTLSGAPLPGSRIIPGLAQRFCQG